MNVIPTALPEVLLLEPRVFEDARGFFFESYNQRVFEERTGLAPRFVQSNHSRSRKDVLRGLHYQIAQPQAQAGAGGRGRGVRRRGRPAPELAHLRQMGGRHRCPRKTSAGVDSREGFAHGFLVLSDSADFLYDTTDYYAPAHERCVIWNDPEIGIEWPLAGEPVLTAKDRAGRLLRDAETYP